jgi:hypothetical protein
MTNTDCPNCSFPSGTHATDCHVKCYREIERLKDLLEDVTSELVRLKQDPDSLLAEYQDRLSVQIEAGYKMGKEIDLLKAELDKTQEALREIKDLNYDDCCDHAHELVCAYFAKWKEPMK